MDYEQITLEISDGVGVLTLNRPDRLNAWTSTMNREMVAAVEHCNADKDVGAIVVTGAGRGFCAGADIRDNFQSRIDSSGGEEAINQKPLKNWVDLVRESKPMIAAVNGASVGVGATLALPMDVIIASEQAKLGMFFVKLGVVPELASSHFLVQRMGIGRASEMCLTGRLYSGAEAFDMGLVDKIVPHEDLMNEAKTMASLIAANPAPHLQWVKALLTQNGSETNLNTVQRREGEALAKAYASAEHKEAVAAFLEKRAPIFER